MQTHKKKQFIESSGLDWNTVQTRATIIIMNNNEARTKLNALHLSSIGTNFENYLSSIILLNLLQ